MAPAAGGLLPYALAAARRGWYVFPLRPRDKRPVRAFMDWEANATTDQEMIAQQFAHGRFNVGIATGPSRLVVVDLDTPKPGEHPPAAWDQPGINDGADVFAALCEEHGQPFPSETFTVRTRRGGWHLYFTAPPDVELRNTKGGTPRGLGWLIDTRAHGGYVVGPGSHVVAPDGAGTYDVLDPAAVPIPLPGWLAHRLTTAQQPPTRVGCSAPAAPVADLPAYAAAALREEVRRVLDSPAQGHHWALNKAAYNLGRFIGADALPRERVENALQAAGEAVHTGREDTPERIAATIRAAIDAGARNPKRTAA